MPGTDMGPDRRTDTMTVTDFRREQRGVAGRMAAALAITLVVLGVALWSTYRADAMPLAERLGMAARIALVPALVIAATIGIVARLRFFSAQDIAGSSAGEASRAVRDGNALVQNSLEQGLLAIVAQGAVAASWPGPQPLMIAGATLFVIGRGLFFTGYRRGARARALGFALTFYPTVALLLLAAVRAF